MKTTFTLNKITFEWDSNKARLNLLKHGIPFELACEALLDPFVLWVDEEVVNGELREKAIGMTENWKLLYVVFTMRSDRIRIISAREVTHAERKRYENP